MPLNRKGGPWRGGYISLGKSGRKTYVIEREVGGERFHVSTRCHIDSAAFKQLERFEANPNSYTPQGDVVREKLLLTNALVEEYERFLLAKPVTPNHAKNMRRRLADWMEDLGPKDLRKLKLFADIKPKLDRRKTCRQHRVIALKGFFSWLREEKGLLENGEDATLNLPVPQAQPEKRKRKKAVEWERVQAALPHLTQRYADVLTVLAATGMHVTELQRFVRSDESELMILPPGSTPLAVLVTLHKNREDTRIPLLHHDHVAAAQRLRASRTIPRHLNAAIRTACAAAEVPAFKLGVMRHTVATWAIADGASPAQVSEFLNHKDKRTTRRFYIDHAVPTGAIPTRQLRLVKSEEKAG